MNRPEYPLFRLTQKRVLPRGNLTEEMVEAINELTISFAPAILGVICDGMELYQTHTFEIRPTQKDVYELELPFGFLECLVQFPKLVAWLEEPLSPVFNLDMNNQQENMRVEFTRVGDRIRHAAVEDHWQSAKRIEGDNDNAPDALRSSCKSIAQEVAAVATALNIAALPSFQDWCRKCGCDLDRPTGQE